VIPEVFEQIAFVLVSLLQLVELFGVDIFQRCSTRTFSTLRAHTQHAKYTVFGGVNWGEGLEGVG